MRNLFLENFTFDWLVNREMAIYTIVIAGVWQSAGFVMALFLAGLRSVEDEIIKAAKIDGAGLFTVYWRILLPMMRPVFFTSFVILVHISIKSVIDTGPIRLRPAGVPESFISL